MARPAPARPWLATLALAALALHSEDATPCAIMPIEAGSAPSLSVERVLLLYDDEHRTEHFVREVRFDGASSTFAFVVPTPTRPELAEVPKPPFDALARDFPLDPPPEQSGHGFFGGEAKAAAAAPGGVEVLSTQRVGKFTAFVLAASDPAALGQWLTENRITVPPGGQAWLQHYVGLRFYFAAFRYEAPRRAPRAGAPSGGQFAEPPPGGAPPPPPPEPIVLGDATMTSETVRLSFATPVPFFPYLEPAHGSSASAGPHTMVVWLVSQHERAPELRRMAAGQSPRWAWPWQAHMAYERDPDVVAQPLGDLATLLPRGEDLHVQTFRDDRLNRDGWGDIVFPVKDASLEEPAWRKVATSILGDLETGLHIGTLEEGELVNEERFRVTPSAHSCACDIGGSSEEPVAWLPAAGLALGLFFRRAAPRGRGRAR